MRIETIGDATLYNGDCLEVIPTLHGIGAVCTDPPYGIEDIVGGYGRAHENIANDKDLSVCMSALQAACRIAPSALWAVFYSPRVRRQFMSSLPSELHDLGEIIWDKKAPGMGRGIRYQHETVAIFYTGDPKPLLKDTFSVLTHYRSAEQHPHQKPAELMKRLVQCVSAGITLDPFMGSGTTGVACAQMGKKFTGIELDPRYFDIACERIQKAYDQGDMFVDAPKAEPAADMFAPANDNAEVSGAAA
jgi:DNA modification methylase